MIAPIRANVEQIHSGSDQPGADATSILTVDLGALRRNYRALKKVVGKCECAAVVKADAYGVGVGPVVQTLTGEGCKTFFVATIEEAHQVRPLASGAIIYVLNGLFPNSASILNDVSARPVLGSLDEIAEWAEYCQSTKKTLPAAIHIDTGMNRLGLTAEDVGVLSQRPELYEAFELSLVMSHLACADDPDSEKNKEQFQLFQRLRAKFPNCPASLANSAGILLGKNYHMELVRPGIALYGGRALIKGPNPMKPVVRLDGRIVQVRQAEKGKTVGYGATHTLARPSRLATVAIGYADGFFRILGKSDMTPSAFAYVNDHPAPVLGRVSMDLVSIDVTDVPAELVKRGCYVELIGPNMELDEVARRANTIGYEILTNLGRRCHKRYIGH